MVCCRLTSPGDFYMAPFVICEAHLAEFSLTDDDDFLILGCDGVWDEIEDQEAVDIVRNSEGGLYDKAVRVRDYSYLLSSEDNVSVIIVSLKPQTRPRSMEVIE